MPWIDLLVEACALATLVVEGTAAVPLALRALAIVVARGVVSLHAIGSSQRVLAACVSSSWDAPATVAERSELLTRRAARLAARGLVRTRDGIFILDSQIMTNNPTRPRPGVHTPMSRPFASFSARLRSALGCAVLVASTAGTLHAEEVLAKTPNPAGGLCRSSWVAPDGSDSDIWACDDFTLDTTQAITEVRWRGGYAVGAPYGHATDFRISIFPSIAGGFQPVIVAMPEDEELEAWLINFHTGDDAGETLVGTVGGLAMYEYRALLPTPFVAEAGTKYWIRIEASQPVYPDWGVAACATGGHFRYVTGMHMYQYASWDLAFALHARWTDLGAALAGTAGAPSLAGSGTLSAGSGNALTLGAARPSSPATLLVGVTKLNAAFKGGTLVPFPSLLLFLSTDPTGGLVLPFSMPAGLPPGALLVFQFWISDPLAVAGFAASNGLSGVSP